MLRPADLEHLTEKQAEVVDLYQRGMSQRSIALYLGVSREAVRDRLGRAEVKLEIASRQGLTNQLSPNSRSKHSTQ